MIICSRLDPYLDSSGHVALEHDAEDKARDTNHDQRRLPSRRDRGTDDRLAVWSRAETCRRTHPAVKQARHPCDRPKNAGSIRRRGARRCRKYRARIASVGLKRQIFHLNRSL